MTIVDFTSAKYTDDKRKMCLANHPNGLNVRILFKLQVFTKGRIQTRNYFQTTKHSLYEERQKENLSSTKRLVPWRTLSRQCLLRNMYFYIHRKRWEKLKTAIQIHRYNCNSKSRTLLKGKIKVLKIALIETRLKINMRPEFFQISPFLREMFFFLFSKLTYTRPEIIIKKKQY